MAAHWRFGRIMPTPDATSAKPCRKKGIRLRGGSHAEALRLAPDCAEAHNNLGNVFHAQGRLDDAWRRSHAPWPPDRPMRKPTTIKEILLPRKEDKQKRCSPSNSP